MSEISWWPSGCHSRGQAGTIAGGTRKEMVQVSGCWCITSGVLRTSFKFFGSSLGRRLCIGAEASLVSKSGMTSSRRAFCAATQSSKMLLVNTGAVQSLHDGPRGRDLAFQIIWAGFRMIRKYFASRPEEIK